MSDFMYFDLGHQDGGSVVEVVLDNQVAVRLLDAPNYSAYQNGRGFTDYGIWATKSPVRIAVPHAGHWTVVLDLGGASGRVRASVNVLTAIAA